MDITTKIIKLETNEHVFRGKTGSSIIQQEDDHTKSVLGWFAGWVERKDRNEAYTFAVNIEGEDGASGKEAREIAEKILKENGSALRLSFGIFWI